MRQDALGLLWQDTRRPFIEKIREQPPIPHTGWKTPTTLPNLAPARCLSVDVETFDPELGEHRVGEYGEKTPGRGPGWARGKGHVVGVSIGTDTGERWYFPVRHEVQPEANLDPAQVFPWLQHELGRVWQPKVGANLAYDYGWLRQEGVQIQGDLIDVQSAEALLAEAARVNLDALGVKYLREGKESPALYQWAAMAYGGEPGPDQRKNIYRCPPCLVGPYAESDADLPLRVIREQYHLLQAEGLLDLFKLESDLIPLLTEMRFAGVAVDIPRAEALRETLLAKEAGLQRQIDTIAGYPVNTNAAESLAPTFDRLGIHYPLTPKTQKPSITKTFLEQLEGCPFADLIKDLRSASKLRGTFVESYILGSHVNGRIFCQFHPLRADKGGTRSGRFSSSTPNLQNIPSRDAILAPLMRGLFIPDAGHLQWRKFDYSQIEYRFLAHYATGPGSDELRAQYNADPKTDYHKHTQALVASILQMEIERKPIKTINFGLIFGMGKDKLQAGLGLDEESAIEFFEAYHEAAPFAKATMEACAEEAELYGSITTILGRKSRFDLWEPAQWSPHGERAMGLPHQAAIEEYGGDIRRAMLHKALNRRLQGSAADMLKVAMRQCWQSGAFAATGVPRLTVHDELDFSDPGGREAAEGFREVKRIMETALRLRVPVIADEERGPDWGHVEEVL